MLEPALFIGLGVVALWAYSHYPKLRPGTLVRAVVHVAISFIGFMLLPTALRLLLPLADAHALQLTVALALLFPALTYVLLSWVWLIARILEMFRGTPRGGHPVTNQR